MSGQVSYGNTNGQPLNNRNRNASGQFNYRNTFRKKHELALGASMGYGRSENERWARRETFLLNDTSLLQQSFAQSRNKNVNRQINANYEWRIDSLQNLSAEINWNRNRSNASAENINDTKNNFTHPVNDADSRNSNENNNGGWGGSVTYNRQLDTFGRSLSLRLNYNQSGGDGSGFNRSRNQYFYTDGSVRKTDNIDQQRVARNHNRNLSISAGYNMPVFKNWFLHLGYNLSDARNNSLQNVFDYEPISNTHSSFNDFLSNGVVGHQQGHSLNTSLGRTRKGLHYNFRFGFRYQNNYNLHADSIRPDIQRFFNITPGLSLNYYKKNAFSIRFNYNGNTTQPNFFLRQPVIDNSNPLFIRLGNPDLRPEYSNQVNVSMNTGKQGRRFTMSGQVNFYNTFNKVTTAVWYDKEGRQTSKPINLSGAYTLNNNNSIAYILSKKKKLRANFNTNLSVSRTLGLINDQFNRGLDLTTGARLTLQYDQYDWFDLEVSGRYSYQKTRYNINTRNNAEFGSYTLRVQPEFELPGEIDLTNSFEYVNRGKRVQFQRTTAMWNVSVTKKIINNKVHIRFRANDLLRQYINYSLNTGNNYIEESETNTIRRYWMLSVSYNFERFGS
jgi:hypothetical protein